MSDPTSHEAQIIALTVERDALKANINARKKENTLFRNLLERVIGPGSLLPDWTLFAIEIRKALDGEPAEESLLETSIGEIDFTLLTREEAIAKIRKLEDPKLRPLIKWIAESLAFGRVAYDARVCIANAERDVEAAVSADQKASQEDPIPDKEVGGFYDGKRCPCEFEEIEPCSRMCSCRSPNASAPCLRCCTVGSPEQRLAKARSLVAREKSALEDAKSLISSGIKLTEAVIKRDDEIARLRDPGTKVKVLDGLVEWWLATDDREEIPISSIQKFRQRLIALQECKLVKWPPLDPGTKVKTGSATSSKADLKGWLPECLASRQWGVAGVIIKHHDSHGLSYEVQHEDGTVGHYDPLELEVLNVLPGGEALGSPKPLCQGVAERSLASEILEEAKRRVWRDARGSDLTLNNAVAVLEGLKQDLLGQKGPEIKGSYIDDE